MLIVDTGIVYLTRGDDAVLAVTLTQDDGAPYEMQPGDELIFTMRDMPEAESPVLARITAQSPRIVIRHDDTKDIEVGAYSADVQLMTADGKRITVWPMLEILQRTRVTNWKNMVIMPEVTTE